MIKKNQLVKRNFMKMDEYTNVKKKKFQEKLFPNSIKMNQ